MLLLTLTTLALTPLSQGGDPRPLTSKIDEVTIYGSSASIRRRAQVPAGDGKFVLQGLPHGLESTSVRVRTEGGEVVGVEVRDRVQENTTDPRAQALRDQIALVESSLAELDDDKKLAEMMRDHFVRLLLEHEDEQRTSAREGRVDTDLWEKNYEYLRGKLHAVMGERRELEGEIDVLRIRLNDLRLELGRFEGQGGVRLKDVVIDRIDLDGQGGPLEVEYVVGGAGWQPYYDLRAKKDLSKVELAYRARVWQRSGEDWTDANIVLSTAQPQRGAQGPEPRPIWLSLANPEEPKRKRGRAEYGMDSDAPSSLRALGYSEGGAVAAEAPRAIFAEVSSEGLSARFRLPRRETIESRSEPTTVLVGRTDLNLDPEHYVVPALDTTVWLRAKARNESPWVMLPGRAAVYFGADFVGHAQMSAVQVDQEFTLHLGADPGLIVERTQLEDLREGSGIFSSKATLNESWRIELENAGAFSSNADGSVEVIVHDVLPRAKDDRIRVSLKDATPKLATGERWKKEREESGVLTWVLRIAPRSKQTIQFRTEIDYPEKLKLIRR